MSVFAAALLWIALPSQAQPAPSAPPAAPAVLVPVALPAPRHGHRIELVDGGLLCFGGFGDASVPDRETRQTWWLAPGSKKWERRADMGTGRAFFASAVVHGAAFALGEGLERYDSKHDRWEPVPITGAAPGDWPRSHFAAAAVGSTIYALGGYGGRRTGLLAIDLGPGSPEGGPTAALRELPAPPGFDVGDHFHCLQTLQQKLHVLGGLDGVKFEPQVEHWVLPDDRPGQSVAASPWKPGAAPPVGLWAKFTVQARSGESLYLFGDFGAWRFESSAGTWTERARPPFLMAMPQAVSLDGSIWVIGGMRVGAEEDRVPILLRYDQADDRWTVLGG
ncbi:MAG: hypothetical protein IPK67_01410 [Planctomycetes bacterium]|nr:hypothetical protein [Planctomycetota bacterium]